MSDSRVRMFWISSSRLTSSMALEFSGWRPSIIFFLILKSRGVGSGTSVQLPRSLQQTVSQGLISILEILFHTSPLDLMAATISSSVVWMPEQILRMRIKWPKQPLRRASCMLFSSGNISRKREAVTWITSISQNKCFLYSSQMARSLMKMWRNAFSISMCRTLLFSNRNNSSTRDWKNRTCRIVTNTFWLDSDIIWQSTSKILQWCSVIRLLPIIRSIAVTKQPFIPTTIGQFSSLSRFFLARSGLCFSSELREEKEQQFIRTMKKFMAGQASSLDSLSNPSMASMQVWEVITSIICLPSAIRQYFQIVSISTPVKFSIIAKLPGLFTLAQFAIFDMIFPKVSILTLILSLWLGEVTVLLASRFRQSWITLVIGMCSQ